MFHVFAAVFRSLFLLLWLWLASYIRDTHTLLRATERLSGRCEDLYLIIKVMFTLCVLVSIICTFEQTIIIRFYNSDGLCVLIRWTQSKHKDSSKSAWNEMEHQRRDLPILIGSLREGCSVAFAVWISLLLNSCILHFVFSICLYFLWNSVGICVRLFSWYFGKPSGLQY